MEFSIKNFDDPSFQILLEHPESVFLKIHSIAQYINSIKNFDKTFELVLRFGDYDIKTEVTSYYKRGTYMNYPISSKNVKKKLYPKTKF